ncbi:hypothetical protein [Micromonospora arida]|uniref:hypothetical protein n=1 Tax=Micromonospora arida TaxID=2203715 RepID=UPI003CF64F64
MKLLTRINDLDRGVLVVHPTPGTTGRTDLALAVLAALGKHLDPRLAHHRRDWWHLAQAWAVGHHIEHVVVDRAHTLSADLIHDLVSLAHAARAGTVWFVDATTPGTAPALAGLDAATVAFPHHLHALADLVPRRPPHRPDGFGHIAALTMPHAGFLTFRYACQRQLPADQVHHVDAAWRATFDAVQAWLLRLPPLDRSVRPAAAQVRAALPAIGETLSVRLAALLYTAANQATAMLRLRATEAALFRHGLWLRHQPRRATGQQHLLRCPLTPIVAATIHRTVSTNAAAAAVLHLVYPLDSIGHVHTAVPHAWRVNNLDIDGSQLLTHHGAIPVPYPAQPALRAHLNFLTVTGRNTADAPLIDQRRQDQTRLAQQVLAPLKLTPTTAPRQGFRDSVYLYGYATAWMADRGLSLHALTDLDPVDGPISLRS